jgi:hypothetical protein
MNDQVSRVRVRGQSLRCITQGCESDEDNARVRTARQLSARRPTHSCTSLRIFFESHEQSVIWLRIYTHTHSVKHSARHS